MSKQLQQAIKNFNSKNGKKPNLRPMSEWKFSELISYCSGYKPTRDRVVPMVTDTDQIVLMMYD